jgi:transcription-repair coupling factor (superfamily II helicase)
MAMTGIIDVSTIDTPPLNKKPIKTKIVSSEDVDYIKERIEFELNRDGQCYILFNDTNRLENKKEEILDLMKDSGLELNIGIIHGKLKPKETDEIMNDFKNRKYNILLATTIIEVGMNIASCNSIIIIGSDKLGLAQLHQLRNRVSRGGIQGYCVLVYDKNLSGIAIKRLKAMEEHYQLGSGEVLARIDMELRGSGTIIGVQQSGHISKVGLDLYNELLGQEIQRQKEELI